MNPHSLTSLTSLNSLKPLSALLASCAALLAATPAASAPGGHDHSPKHGGVVVQAKDKEYELVARKDVITLHVRDHGKAADLSKASAKLTLLSGTEKSEVMLAPAGDRLQAKGDFKVAAGTKVVAVVQGAGNAPVTARFTLK